MLNELSEFGLRNRLRPGSRTQSGGAPVASMSKLKIVDAAFGDLETINLCRVDTSATFEGQNARAPQGRLVQDLAGELRALDQRFREISQLLHALQTPVSGED